MKAECGCVVIVYLITLLSVEGENATLATLFVYKQYAAQDDKPVEKQSVLISQKPACV